MGNPLFVFRLPKYASKFIEMCLMVTADHGPAVSGAHNTIVCARAGKDLVSSLASGLLTIVSSIHICSTCIADFWPHTGSVVVRTDVFRFLSGCHKKRLNQVLSYLLACF